MAVRARSNNLHKAEIKKEALSIEGHKLCIIIQYVSFQGSWTQQIKFGLSKENLDYAKKLGLSRENLD